MFSHVSTGGYPWTAQWVPLPRQYHRGGTPPEQDMLWMGYTVGRIPYSTFLSTFCLSFEIYFALKISINKFLFLFLFF